MAIAALPAGVGRDEVYWAELGERLVPWDGLVQARDILVLTPHPDDEVLGCGGLLQRWNRLCPMEIWMVTDGEACYGQATISDAAGDAALPDLAEVVVRRRDEAREAHRRLQLDTPRIRWLGLPDGMVEACLPQLESALRLRVNANTVLVAPLHGDGHADHDAIGSVARAVARARGALLLSYPIWYWHFGRIEAFDALPGVACRYELSAAEQHRKREAIAAFESQLGVSATPTVLPRRVLRHFRRTYEVVLREDFDVPLTQMEQRRPEQQSTTSSLQ